MTTDTTKLLVEMFPGIFVGVTIPTRYLVWQDDRPKSPDFNPGLRRLLLGGEVTMTAEEVN
jgi:hypothetical protein